MQLEIGKFKPVVFAKFIAALAMNLAGSQQPTQPKRPGESGRF
ncbi:hypothetical protein [Anaerosinus massiliensis]|nr:hypothetical protein [Massilibacillus massiliensis]